MQCEGIQMLTFDRKHPHRFLRRRERGQSLVESLFGFTIMLFILSGLLDLGRLYFTYVAMEDAVGEASLYLSINPDCPYLSSTGCSGINNSAESRALRAAGGWVTLDTAGSTLLVACYDKDDNSTKNCPDAEVGDTVEVVLQYDFKLLLAVIPEINSAAADPTIITLTSHATQVIIEAD
jgi:hypothetical protein